MRFRPIYLLPLYGKSFIKWTIQSKVAGNYMTYELKWMFGALMVVIQVMLFFGLLIYINNL